jgi:predicted heme/steroid binding protein
MDSMSDAPEEAAPTGESEAIDEPVADAAADPAGEAASVGPTDEPTTVLPAVPAQPAEEVPAGFRWPRGLQATATRRALLLTALGGLLIAGLATALPAVGTGPGRLAGYIDSDPVPSTGTRSNAAFSRAASGDCLTWPEGNPDAASIVKCSDDHRFEVAESLDMRTFPGSEYGPSAVPPSPARIQQITQEQCEAAVRQYMGTKFDPNSKFSVSLLWSGDRAWRQSGDRRMLCGLQQPAPNNQQTAFKGKVADIDQSKVWPAGTCLGIDSATNQPIDVPVDCAAPHAMEVTGTVNLAEKFPTALPAEPEQDGFIKDSCTKMTDAYLAPTKLRTTTLTLIYPTVSLPSWAAGSREVACSIGATLGNGGWATLVNSAKGPLLINGQPPVPPPDIPEERLTLPPIPVQAPPAQSPQAPQQTSAPDAIPPGNQHLPQQPVVTAPQSTATQAPAAPPAQAPPPDGGGPPPLDGGGPPPAGPGEPAPGN